MDSVDSKWKQANPIREDSVDSKWKPPNPIQSRGLSGFEMGFGGLEMETSESNQSNQEDSCGFEMGFGGQNGSNQEDSVDSKWN